MMSNKLPRRMIFDGLNCYPESAFPDWAVKKEGWRYVTVSAEAPSPVPQEVEEALKAVDWGVSEQDQNIPVEHAETLAAYIRSLSSPAPVEALALADEAIGTIASAFEAGRDRATTGFFVTRAVDVLKERADTLRATLTNGKPQQEN